MCGFGVKKKVKRNNPLKIINALCSTLLLPSA